MGLVADTIGNRKPPEEKSWFDTLLDNAGNVASQPIKAAQGLWELGTHDLPETVKNLSDLPGTTAAGVGAALGLSGSDARSLGGAVNMVNPIGMLQFANDVRSKGLEQAMTAPSSVNTTLLTEDQTPREKFLSQFPAVAKLEQGFEDTLVRGGQTIQSGLSNVPVLGERIEPATNPYVDAYKQGQLADVLVPDVANWALAADLAGGALGTTAQSARAGATTAAGGTARFAGRLDQAVGTRLASHAPALETRAAALQSGAGLANKVAGAPQNLVTAPLRVPLRWAQNAARAEEGVGVMTAPRPLGPLSTALDESAVGTRIGEALQPIGKYTLQAADRTAFRRDMTTQPGGRLAMDQRANPATEYRALGDTPEGHVTTAIASGMLTPETVGLARARLENRQPFVFPEDVLPPGVTPEMLDLAEQHFAGTNPDLSAQIKEGIEAWRGPEALHAQMRQEGTGEVAPMAPPPGTPERVAFEQRRAEEQGTAPMASAIERALADPEGALKAGRVNREEYKQLKVMQDAEKTARKAARKAEKVTDRTEIPTIPPVRTSAEIAQAIMADPNHPLAAYLQRETAAAAASAREGTPLAPAPSNEFVGYRDPFAEGKFRPNRPGGEPVNVWEPDTPAQIDLESLYQANPSNALRIEYSDLTPGEAAVRELAGPERFAGLERLTPGELRAHMRDRFGVSGRNIPDDQLIATYGAELAKEAGYDAISVPGRNQAVLLDNAASSRRPLTQGQAEGIYQSHQPRVVPLGEATLRVQSDPTVAGLARHDLRLRSEAEAAAGAAEGKIRAAEQQAASRQSAADEARATIQSVLEENPAFAPPAYRPLIKYRQESVKGALDDAKQLREAGDLHGAQLLEDAAADVATTLRDMQNAGQVPEALHVSYGTGDKPAQTATPRPTALAKKAGSQYERTGQEVNYSPEYQYTRWLEDVARRRVNETVQGLAQRTGMRADQVPAEAFDNYVPFDPEKLGSPLPADKINENTLMVPRPLMDAAKDMQRHQFSNPNVELLAKGSAAFQRGWKTFVLPLSPKWLVGNVVGNSLMLGMVPGGMGTAVKGDALRALRDPDYLTEAVKGQGAAQQLGEQRALLGDLDEAAVQQGLKQSPTETFGQLLRQGKIGKAAVRGAGNVPKGAYRLNQLTDDFGHVAAAVAIKNDMRAALAEADRLLADGRITQKARDDIHAAKSMTDEQIVAKANQAIGDFKNLSGFERDVVRQFVPFYPWAKHITKLAFKLPFESPYRVAWTLAIGDLFADQAEFAQRPEWLKSSIHLGGGQYLRAPWNPFPGGVTGSPFTSPQNALGALTPLAQWPLAAMGLNTGQGRMVTRAPDGTDQDKMGFIGVGNTLSYLGRQIPQIRTVEDTVGENILRYDTGQPHLVNGKKIATTNKDVGPFPAPVLRFLTGAALDEPDLAGAAKRDAAKTKQARRSAKKYERARTRQGV